MPVDLAANPDLERSNWFTAFEAFRNISNRARGCAGSSSAQPSSRYLARGGVASPVIVAPNWEILDLADNLTLAAGGAFGEDFPAKRRIGPKPATIRRVVTAVADHCRLSQTDLDEAIYVRSGERRTITRKRNQYRKCSLVIVASLVHRTARPSE
jgi:hypothetical protein